MAKDLNKVQFTGYLGADPDMRYTPQGSAVTNFSVASGRTWKDKEGNQHENTEWFRVVAWDRLAEICNQYLTKGTRVYIEGRLQTRKWTDRDGQDRYSTEVIAQDMIILSSRNGERAVTPEIHDTYEEIDSAPPPAAAPPAPTAPPAARRPVVNANGNGSVAPPAPDTARKAPPAPAPARSTVPRPPTRNQPQVIENDDDIPF